MVGTNTIQIIISVSTYDTTSYPVVASHSRQTAVTLLASSSSYKRWLLDLQKRTLAVIIMPVVLL